MHNQFMFSVTVLRNVVRPKCGDAQTSKFLLPSAPRIIIHFLVIISDIQPRFSTGVPYKFFKHATPDDLLRCVELSFPLDYHIKTTLFFRYKRPVSNQLPVIHFSMCREILVISLSV